MKNKNKRIRPEYIKKYDILRWNALQTNASSKNRPFLVVRVTKSRITAIPITHSAPTNYKHLYNFYNTKASPNINQAIKEMTHDKKIEPNYFKPAQRVKVAKSSFASKQLPQRLGNLKDYVERSEIRQQQKQMNQDVKQMYQAVENYEQQDSMTQKEYLKKAEQKEALKKEAFVNFLVAQDYGEKARHKKDYQPKRIYQPKKHYQRSKPKKSKVIDFDDYLQDSL